MTAYDVKYLEVTQMLMETMKPVSKTRVQLDLSPLEIERMNWMMLVCGIESRKDLFNNALTLLEWATYEVAEGRKVASYDDATQERSILSMPALNNASVNARRYPSPRMSGSHVSQAINAK